jgi:hypothetical protein
MMLKKTIVAFGMVQKKSFSVLLYNERKINKNYIYIYIYIFPSDLLCGKSIKCVQILVNKMHHYQFLHGLPIDVIFT